MYTRASAKVVGDYGNPSGTGIASMSFEFLNNYAAGDMATLQTAVQTFHVACKTAQLVATNVGDITTAVVSENMADKPAADINVDRVLVCTYRTIQDAHVKRITLHGVPATSTSIDKTAAGERINEAGKTALAAALEDMLGIAAPDGIVILTGKVLQKA